MYTQNLHLRIGDFRGNLAVDGLQTIWPTIRLSVPRDGQLGEINSISVECFIRRENPKLRMRIFASVIRVAHAYTQSVG